MNTNLDALAIVAYAREINDPTQQKVRKTRGIVEFTPAIGESFTAFIAPEFNLDTGERGLKDTTFSRVETESRKAEIKKYKQAKAIPEEALIGHDVAVNTLTATMRNIVSACNRLMDRVVIDGASSSVSVSRTSASTAYATKTYIQDGVKVIDATKGFTYDTASEISSAFQENKVYLGQDTMDNVRIFLTSKVFAQLKSDMKKNGILYMDFFKKTNTEFQEVCNMEIALLEDDVASYKRDGNFILLVAIANGGVEARAHKNFIGTKMNMESYSTPDGVAIGQMESFFVPHISFNDIHKEGAALLYVSGYLGALRVDPKRVVLIKAKNEFPISA
jgi:hypothetical protein